MTERPGMGARAAPPPNHGATGGLDWLLAPLGLETFFAEHLAKTPLRLPRDRPDYYHAAFAASDLDPIVTSACLVPGSVEIIPDGGRPRTCRAAAEAWSAIERGDSVRVDSVQRFSFRLRRLCASLERQLSYPTNVNLYYTPSGHRALKRHFDTHDVFVLQISGRKIWRLYGPPAELPLEYLPLLRGERLGDVKLYRLDTATEQPAHQALHEQFCLDAGDLLYLPRGHWHEAEADGREDSCHLTIGIQAPTYAELITAMVAEAARNVPSLRESLPPGWATTPHEPAAAARARLESVLRSALPQFDAAAGLTALAGVFARRGPRVPSSPRPPQPAVALGTVVLLSGDVPMAALANGEQLLLLCAGHAEQLDARFGPACGFAARRGEFAAADLPGALTDAERVAFVGHLVAQGAAIPVSRCRVAAIRKPPGLADLPPGSAWVPLHVKVGPDPAVLWQALPGGELDRPFFSQSIAAARRAGAAACRTTLEPLTRPREARQASGLIFHVSRCGSTLVSNCMRVGAGATVVSEASVINDAVWPLAAPGFSDGQRASAFSALQGIVSAFGRLQTRAGLVLKLSSWNILAIRELREALQAPAVIVIRDPVEVMVSCLEARPGWMRSDTPAWRSWLLAGEPCPLDEVEYCARVPAGFYRAALEASDCRVLEHSRISRESILSVADLFGIPRGM